MDESFNSKFPGKDIPLSQLGGNRFCADDDDNIEIDPLSMTEDEILTEEKEKTELSDTNENRKKDTFEQLKFNKTKTYKFDENEKERFEFIKPNTLKDPSLKEAFSRIGINDNNCIIIKNKDSFLSHLYDIREMLSKVLLEYITTNLLSIDPLRQQNRRQGFSLDVNKGLINKEIFLNTQNVGEPEKGKF